VGAAAGYWGRRRRWLQRRSGGGVGGGGGGGGSIVDPSAIMVSAQVSGVASPDGSPNGEIIMCHGSGANDAGPGGFDGLCFLLFRTSDRK